MLKTNSTSPTNATTGPDAPLAIIGIGCLFPKADGPGAYWANVRDAVDCITPVPPTHWNPDDYFDPDPKKPDMTYAHRGGFLSVVDFNPLEFGIAPRDIEATDTSQLLGLVAAKQALTDAGVVLGDSSPKAVARDRVSVILGVTGTLELVVPLGARLGHPKWRQAMKDAGIPDEAAADAAERIAESYVPWQENSFPGLLGNVVAGRIANRLDLQGTNCVVDAACASSLSAVHLAALELQTGRADVVVSGGVDTFNDIFMYMCFSKTPALSPTGDAKPFDANGDGTILGEGLGLVVLKRLADAERDGDRIYAVIRGIGSSSDGKGNAIYAPSADGQKRCLQSAYRAAGVTPDTIELVEAHGTGTKVGDAVEATALTEVFNQTGARAKVRPWCALGSVKSQIGHTKAAAGSASLIKAALALYFKVLPPTVKVTQPVEPLRASESPFYVSREKRPWLPRADHPRRAALSAFGFGGSNFHAVLEEHRPAKTEVDWDGTVQLLALSADKPESLAAELAKLPAEVTWKAFARAAEESRVTFRGDAPCRLVLVAQRDVTNLPKLIASAKAKLVSDPATKAWHTPDGASYGAGPAPGKLAVLFPGQGSQAVGMLRDLACQFPEMLDSLAAANAAVAAQQTDESDPRRLTDLIYPPASFEPDAKKRHDAALRATESAQPAIGAVSFGAWRILSERFGVRANAFAGHSYGELPALAASGRLAVGDLFVLSRLRGRLMAQQRPGDPGTMLAVFASAADIQKAIASARLGVVVANRNAPSQTVLSGPTAEIEKAEKHFAAAGVRTTRLPVAAAFHSSLVADAAGPFRAALNGVVFAPASVPVLANTTAALYPADPMAARDLLGNQLANPVDFVGQLQNMLEMGIRTFVEVGPGSILTRLVEATFGAEATAFALDASAGKRSGVLDLAHTLARLAAGGYSPRLAAWEEGSRVRPAADPKPGLTVPVCGANSVLPRPKRPPRPLNTGSSSSPTSVRNSPMSDPHGPPPAGLSQALHLTHQTLAALQQLQEQTASLHRQFLESQEHAQRTLHALVAQQQALLFGGGVPSAPAPIPVPALPVVAAPVVATPATTPLPPPPPPAPVRPAPVVANNRPTHTVDETLLAVVSEKTGYPAEMLDLGMSLDSDLGVDSIKRVEILSALQDRLPNAPQVKPEHLGTLHTLKDVADFLSGGPLVPAELVPSPTIPMIDRLVPPDVADRDALALPNRDEVRAILLAVVSEKTGYPAEMLDLGMSLDSDLGVDSIKRVEILSALQDRLPNAPQVKPEHLGTLHTLKDVADFLVSPSGVYPRTAKVDVTAVRLPPKTDAITGPISDYIIESPVAQTTHRVPGGVTKTNGPGPNLLSPPPSEPSSMVPTPRTNVVERTEELRSGGTLLQPVAPIILDRVDRSILQAVDIDLTVARPRLAFASRGEFWLVAPDDPLAAETTNQLSAQGYKVVRFPWVDPSSIATAGDPVGLILLAPARSTPGVSLNKLGCRWLQHAGPKLRQAARTSGALFATVARLDGTFGLSDLDTGADAASGGLAGLVKTGRHEWPEMAFKAIDLAAGFASLSPAAAATALIDELFLAGPIEIGITVSNRCTLELARTVRRQSTTGPALTPKDVVLITGGARGVTAEVAVALAEVYHPTLILTGRTPLPTGPEPDWIRDISGEAEMKKAVAAHLGASASPKAVSELYAKITAQREVAQTLARIEKTGSKVAYYVVNVANGRQVADLLHQVQVKFGSITALVHGAGVLADRRIEDLTSDQFDSVYTTKVDGLRNLLDLVAHQELKAVILFSSTTARFGRTGQLAYAVANEVLNKMAQIEARRRPGARVVSINWGPWDGGMVTPSLRKVFESEGVGLIPLQEGGLFAVQELTTAGKAVEVIALGKPPRANRANDSGTHDAVRSSNPRTPAQGLPAAPGTPLTTPPLAELAVVFERSLDVVSHPILRSHVLDGRAVLPMALHLEWLAHAALHGNPGLVFHGFNDLRITHGVMVEEAGATVVKALAGKAVKSDKFFHVPVELRGKRRDGRDAVHSRAEVVLSAALPKPPAAEFLPGLQPYQHAIEEVYQYFLFHGPDLHGIEKVDGVADTAFAGTAYPAPPPAEWFTQPLRSSWVADPLVLDASYQMMILWSFAQHGAGSLPCFVGRYRQFRRTFPAGPTRIVIRVTRDNGSFARADIEYLDSDGQVIAQAQDYECVIDRQLDQAFRKNQLAPSVGS